MLFSSGPYKITITNGNNEEIVIIADDYSIDPEGLYIYESGENTVGYSRPEIYEFHPYFNNPSRTIKELKIEDLAAS